MTLKVGNKEINTSKSKDFVHGPNNKQYSRGNQRPCAALAFICVLLEMEIEFLRTGCPDRSA